MKKNYWYSTTGKMNVYGIFDPRPLIVKEQKMISNFIKADKQKNKRRKRVKMSTNA
jgi:hypothetical protein